MTQIIAIRPEPGLTETLELAQEMGIPLKGVALSRALPCDWTAPDPADFDAILAGSANAFRHGGAQLAQFKHLPVLAVGQKTAEAARAAGFTVAQMGSGGLQGLIDGTANQPGRLLRLSGKDHVALKLPDTIQMDSRIVYRMEAMPFAEKDAHMFAKGAIVMLFSASSATHFHAECQRLGANLEQITIAALGPRIAGAAGEGWAAVHSAERPDTADLLALAQTLWQLTAFAPKGGGA